MIADPQLAQDIGEMVKAEVATALRDTLKAQGKVIVPRSKVMDSATTSMVLAFAEIKGFVDHVASQPHNWSPQEVTFAEHIQKIIQRNLDDELKAEGQR